MPAPIDLTGAVLGRLTVLRLEAESAGAAHRKAWRVRCACGRDEVYPQRRLTQDRPPRKPAVRACSVCEATLCQACGASLGARTTRRTCEDCRPAHRKETGRASYHRCRTPRPARPRAPSDETREQDRQDWARRMAREAADPALAEARRARQRERYARHAQQVQEERRAAVRRMTDDEMADLLARQRAYARDYARRRREGFAVDPQAHRAYLDAQQEWRRQRLLRRLAVDAATLMEMLDAR